MAMTRVIGITSPTMVPCLPLGTNSISSSRSPVNNNNNNILPYNKSKLYTRRLHVKNATSFHSDQFFNSRVDEKLVKVLEYEIKSMEGRTSLFECTKSQMPVLPPADFPFSIDESGDGSIVKFKREIHGEHIEICVCEPITALYHEVITDDDTPILLHVWEHYPKYYDIKPLTDYDIRSDTDDDDDKYHCDDEIRVVPLLVKIIKKDATFMINMRVFASADVIFINRVDMVRVPSHDGSSFEVHSSTPEEGSVRRVSDNLQFSLRDFIEARGINKTNAEFWLKFSEEYHKYHREFDFLKAFKHYITHGT